MGSLHGLFFTVVSYLELSLSVCLLRTIDKMKRSAFALQSALSRRRRINAASSTLIRRLARSTLLFHSFIASPSSLRALRIHRHGNPLADEMQRSARRQQVLDLSCTNSVELLVKLNVEQLAAADLFSCGR